MHLLMRLTSSTHLTEMILEMDEMPAFDPHERSRNGGEAGFGDAIAGNAGLSDTPVGNGDRPASMRRTGGLVGIARSHFLEIAETGKSDLLRNVGSIAGLIRELAVQVESIGIEPLSHYARRTTALVDDLHGSVRDKSVEDLIDDGRELVRRNPEIAIVAAAIIGFLGARVLKARE